jgi:hypothetical protein
MKFLNNLFILLFAITFFFEGNTLFWNKFENAKHRPEDYLQLQLDHYDEPAINQDPILRVEKLQHSRLAIFTKDKYWILHYDGSILEWYVEDWRSL